MGRERGGGEERKRRREREREREKEKKRENSERVCNIVVDDSFFF